MLISIHVDTHLDAHDANPVPPRIEASVSAGRDDPAGPGSARHALGKKGFTLRSRPTVVSGP